MKLSTRLGLIVGCAALGALILVFISLQTIRSSMLTDRQEQIRSTVNLAAKQVGVYVALEKAGTLSRDEAQAQAKKALSGLRDGDDYVFARDMVGMVLVHPDSRREGKVDMGAKVPDGRTLMQVYLDSLKTTNLSQVEILTKRPKGEELVPKINGLAKIPEWDWIIGYGLFVDDIDEAYKAYALRFGLIALVIFAVVIALAYVMARRI
ncbi:MAG: cache domain-containing protein, partial [Propionivibrio sp.]